MAKTFSEHGAEVGRNFDLHMIQVCKPEKASKSLDANPERAVLMPKFVRAFTRNDSTQLRVMQYGVEYIRTMVDDEIFPASLTETYQKIVAMIEEAR